MDIAKFGFSLFGINTYVVWDPATKKCAIVDPGMIDAEEEEALANFIKRERLTVTHIINTHLHIDHAIGIKYAKHLFDAPVVAHRADTPLAERMQEQANMFGMAMKVDNVSVTNFVEEGDTIEVGNGRLHVLHVPGHSPGSICLYDKEGGYVITGDALFAGSIGRTDLPGGDTATLLKAIREKLLPLPDSTVVYPGHGPATTIGRERATNPYVR